MKTRHSKHQNNADFLVKALSQDKSFKDHLGDEIFVDYFNTFLSLPIFGKKLFYRKDSRSFEVDPDVGKPGFHFVQESIFSWVNAERAPLFLKTDISNEYRLCRLLNEEVQKQNIQDCYNLNVQKELGNVLAMQRFKAFLHQTAGERVVIFWLAAEKYRRQTVRECRRFVLRELQEKFIQQGALLELPACIKSRFKLDLNENEAEAIVPSDMTSEALIASQAVAFMSLVEYWVPKYLSHREHRIANVKGKWKRAANLEGVLRLNDVPEKVAMFDAYLDLKDQDMTVVSSKTSISLLPSDENSIEKELDRFSLASSYSETFEKRLSKDVLGTPFHPTRSEKSQTSSISYNSEMIITMDDDETDEDATDDDDDESNQSTFANPSKLKLPRLDNSTPVLLEKKKISEPSFPDIYIPTMRSISSSLHGAGNTLQALCGKFRDASLSRAAALSQTVRGSSLIDVEPSSAFPATFIEHNKYLSSQDDADLEYFTAALASDSFAGQPFCEFIRIVNNDEAFANIRFWLAAQKFLSSLSQMDPLTRRRQALAIVHIYLIKDSPRKPSLSMKMRSKLCELLPKDLGSTALTTASVDCAKALRPIWKEFVELDKNCFDEKVPIRYSSPLPPKRSLGIKERVANRRNHRNPRKQEEEKRESFQPKRIWNALQLAIAISVPSTAKPLLEGYEDVNEQDPSSDYQGSLQSQQLRVLNKQAVLALERYRDSNPYQSGMAYYFYHQNLLLSTLGNNSNVNEVNMITTEVPTKHYREHKPRLPKPRVFQEILHDPVQFDAFKKFLMKNDAECPLIFWQAVESMRTNTREAKQRQSRANGILRRFFGPNTGHGRDLACNADIVRELPHMDKVTPAMLVSAQTCVARSMEERWLIPYLSTFPEEDELPGITRLPNFRPIQVIGADIGKGMKRKTRLQWKGFTRNIISFRRGIANHKTLKNFQNFLKFQHVLNVNRSREQGEEQPQRVLISSKLVYTEKLLHDLRFWSEVERYKEFADAVVLCAKLGNYTKDDELIVTKKAKAIVNCFIDSQIPPKIQINICPDTADSILGLVKNDIIERSLFHTAAISVFSILLHYWKKFCYHRLLPLAKLPKCPESARSDRSRKIAMRKDAIRRNKMRRVSIQPEDEYTKIMFSLQNGLRIAVVPVEDELANLPQKLPKINPFKMNKLARSFDIN